MHSKDKIGNVQLVKLNIDLRRLVLTIGLMWICLCGFGQTNTRWRWYELEESNTMRRPLITQDSNFNWYEILPGSKTRIFLKNQVSPMEIRNSTPYQSLIKRNHSGRVLKSTRIYGIPESLNWMNGSMLIATCRTELILRDTMYFYQLRFNSELELLDSQVVHSDYNVYDYVFKETVKNATGLISSIQTIDRDSFYEKYVIRYRSSENSQNVTKKGRYNSETLSSVNIGCGHGYYGVLREKYDVKHSEKTRLTVFDSLGNLAFERFFPIELSFKDIIFNELASTMYVKFSIRSYGIDSFEWNNQWLQKDKYYYMILDYTSGSVQVDILSGKFKDAVCYRYRGKELDHYGSKTGLGIIRYKNFKALDSTSSLEISAANYPRFSPYGVHTSTV